MGKRRVGFKKPKAGISTLKDAGSSDDEQVEAQLDALLDDEINQYNTEKEQALVKKKPKAKKRPQDDSDEEQEVFGLDLTSSEDEGPGPAQGEETDSSDSDLSDLDEDEDIFGSKEDEDGVPDSRAWGRKARLYHNTDYVDQDFGGFEGSDAEEAEQEEAEAREIQKRLTSELDESDFADFIPAKAENVKKGKGDRFKEVLKLDFDGLSVAEKRKLIQRECPEVIHMLEEYKEKLEIAKTTKELLKAEDSPLIQEFYETKYHTILNYCINISYYLYLRATNPANCKGHPVIKRILQFRRLLDELSQFDPEKVQLETERLAKRKLKRTTPAVPLVGRAKKMKPIPEAEQKPLLAAAEDENESEKEDEFEKRGITYEMAKNKGLTPTRQKVQRNPRVKHRLKYQKAKVRRKGQVRTARTEVKKYGGESYGIKSNVTKSIKLK